MACNNDGLWNDVGVSLAFSIAPAYYQAVWFWILCAGTFAGIFWMFYLLRLRQATAQIQQRLGARLEERERIARELHDTLLQGFQGLVLRFQAVMDTLPAHEQAHGMLEDVLDRADGVVLEGRERVRDLRGGGRTGHELPEALKRSGEEFSNHHAATFNLVVLGVPQMLDPVVLNDAERIAREAIANAFRHSSASTLEVELAHEDRRVLIRIRDKGAGIGQHVLESGKDGHWGLSGMRERAEKIGARLTIWSKLGAGTENRNQHSSECSLSASQRFCSATIPHGEGVVRCQQRSESFVLTIITS